MRIDGTNNLAAQFRHYTNSLKLQGNNLSDEHVHADAKSERFRDWQPAIII